MPLDFVGNSVTTTTRLSSGVEDPDTTDNESVAVVTIIRDADVALVKSVSPATVLVGEQATFIVTVTNDGPAPRHGTGRPRSAARRPDAGFVLGVAGQLRAGHG